MNNKNATETIIMKFMNNKISCNRKNNNDKNDNKHNKKNNHNNNKNDE